MVDRTNNYGTRENGALSDENETNVMVNVMGQVAIKDLSSVLVDLRQSTKDLMLCSACQSVRFCSRECQRQFWPRRESYSGGQGVVVERKGEININKEDPILWEIDLIKEDLMHHLLFSGGISRFADSSPRSRAVCCSRLGDVSGHLFFDIIIA